MLPGHFVEPRRHRPAASPRSARRAAPPAGGRGRRCSWRSVTRSSPRRPGVRAAAASPAGSACWPPAATSSSAAATSVFESCSKCRITTISWSCGSSCATGVFEPPLQLAPRRRGGGRQLPVAQLRRDVPRRLVARQADLERLLAVEAPPRGHAVPAVGVDQPVLGHLPQPQVKRHLRILQILLQPPMGFDQHILRDVASIDAPRQHRVHPQLDHPPHRAAMPCQQPIDGRIVAGAGVCQEFLRVVRVRPHDSS